MSSHLRPLMYTVVVSLTVVLLSACGQAKSGGADAGASATPTCDRPCLDGLVNRYLDALVAHDPSKIPTTTDVRFVENGVQLHLAFTPGLWKTASGRGTYSHYFADVTAGQAGFIGTMRERGKGLILVLRLAVTGRQVREIEQLAIRTGQVDEYEKLTPDPLWTAAVPESSRSSRAELIALADRYYSGMQRNDPKGDYSFFHKGCNRIEHGRQTTNMPPSNYGHSDIPNFVTMGCEAQFQTGFLGFVTGIRDRRYPVIDEERQTVLAFAFFDHDGSIRSIPLSTGQTFKVPPYFSSPRTLMIAEGFKVADKKLRLIEAALTESPYGMKSVLDTPPTAPARKEPATACDQACTRSLVDGVLAAMIARDPVKASLAATVRYTENGQPLPIGDGLWKTLTARGTYNLYLAAPPDGDPAFFGSIVETDIPGQLSLRLRQQGGRITEIEALVVRQEIAMLGKLIGTGTLFAPPQLADFDATQFRSPLPVLTATVPPTERTPVAALRETGRRYAKVMFSAGDAPSFAERCTARENGVPSVSNRALKPLQLGSKSEHPFWLTCTERAAKSYWGAGLGVLRGQPRILAADEAQGLVLLSVVVNISGEGEDQPSLKVPDAFRAPSTYLRSVLLKVRNDRIEHAETITRPVFFGLNDGWTD